MAIFYYTVSANKFLAHCGIEVIQHNDIALVIATEQWNRTAEFLRTQGIKPDAVDMPPFTNLLPEVKAESQTVDGEIEGDF